MSHLPRNGRYELFTHGYKTYCFDDPSFEGFRTPEGMFEWIRVQDPDLWRPMRDDPNSNTALYLTPELYVIWKLRWA
jgi:hypothetical protein